MRIKSADIMAFGKLKSRQYEFGPGLNIIYGPNGSGKTTLYSFICDMLFGIGRSRGRGARTDEYRKYEPMDAPSLFAGSLRFECGGKYFRLTRDFVSASKKDTLISESDHEIMSVDRGDLDMLLGYTAKDTFLGISTVAQERDAAADGIAAELQEQYIEAAMNQESGLELKEALKSLSEEKKELEKAVKEQAREEQRKKETVRMQLDTLEKEKERAAKRLETFRSKAENRKKAGDENETAPERGAGVCVPGVILLIAAILFAAVGLWLCLKEVSQTEPVLFISAAVLAAAAILSFYMHGRDSERAADIEETEREQDLDWQLEYLNGEFEEVNDRLLKTRQQAESLESIYARESEEETRLKGVNIAIARLDELSAEIYKGFSEDLRDQMNEIYRGISGQKGAEVFLNDELEYGIYENGSYIPSWQCSKGTRELLDFSLRMASYYRLSPDEPLPVLLDDAFVNYDDRRAYAVLKWLSTLDRQILLFTCQGREKAVLDRLEADYLLVRMP